MSISVLLVPLGMAIAAAVSAAGQRLEEEGLEELTPIRVVDPQLVAASLARLGAQQISVEGDVVTAETAHGQVSFQRVGEVMAGVVHGLENEQSREFCAAVEDAAGHLAQARAASLAKEQAESLGFRLIEESTDEGTINYVFEEI